MLSKDVSLNMKRKIDILILKSGFRKLNTKNGNLNIFTFRDNK